MVIPRGSEGWSIKGMNRKSKDSELPKIVHQGFTQRRRSLSSGESLPTKPDLTAQMLAIASNVSKGFTFKKQDVAVEEPTADDDDPEEA